MVTAPVTGSLPVTLVSAGAHVISQIDRAGLLAPLLLDCERNDPTGGDDHDPQVPDGARFHSRELLVVVAVIGVLATIAIRLYANVLARGRIAKAQADSRSLAAAVGVSAPHGSDPSALISAHVRRDERAGQPRGPVHEFGARPAGWVGHVLLQRERLAHLHDYSSATVPASAFRSAARQRRFERIAS